MGVPERVKRVILDLEYIASHISDIERGLIMDALDRIKGAYIRQYGTLPVKPEKSLSNKVVR